MTQNKEKNGLNELLIGLLRMFNRNIPDEDIRAIKRVIVKHLSSELLDEVNKVVAEKEITEEDFLALESDHFRTILEK